MVGKGLVPCVAIYLKGDWAEYSSTIGMPTWHDAQRPCFGCKGFGSDLYISAGNSIDGLRWPSVDIGDFDQACRRCEREVIIASDRMRDDVATILAYSKSSATNAPMGEGIDFGLSGIGTLEG